MNNNDTHYNLLQGDAATVLRTLPSESVQMCVTSPPYFGLRRYLRDGDPNAALEIGIEETPAAYVANLVAVFREVRRVLKADGVLWCNLGDSYAGSGRGLMGDGSPSDRGDAKQGTNKGTTIGQFADVQTGLPAKNRLGIPHRVVFALQDDGWIWRDEIVWHKCLSGGAWVYVRTQKGDMPMILKDVARLVPSTVQLWNGEKWTQLMGMTRTKRDSTELEIVLRSGERISCTTTHRWPTERGLLTASDLVVGDVFKRTQLPEPTNPLDSAHIDTDVAWLAGLYVAEGSMSGDKIQIAGHVKEDDRWVRVQRIAESYGGTATRTIDGNNMNIRIYGKVLVALIRQFVTGKTAKSKGFAPVCWRYSNAFLSELLAGYLSGDGHWNAANERWRIGFARNYNLERDLRTICARLGHHLVLNLSTTTFENRTFPTFRGEIRFTRSGHPNEKNPCAIAEIRKARCREVYDLTVADEPHLFALASGILSHNSNPMPESVTDRTTKAHEFIFMLTKQPVYYYDADAVREPMVCTGRVEREVAKGMTNVQGFKRDASRGDVGVGMTNAQYGARQSLIDKGGRNKRSVWTVSSEPYAAAHFATFPPKLITPCILAGSRPGDTVLDCFSGSGTTGSVALEHGRNYIGIDLNPDYNVLAEKRINGTQPQLIFNAIPETHP